MSSRRPIRMDSGAANFLAERDEHEEEDVDVVADVVEDSKTFDIMAMGLRGGPPQPQGQLELSHDFDVVESPSVVKKEMEEEKGAIVQISNPSYNIVKDKNHFEMDNDNKVATVDDNNAYEDSDEEFAPLESIVPAHL